MILVIYAINLESADYLLSSYPGNATEHGIWNRFAGVSLLPLSRMVERLIGDHLISLIDRPMWRFFSAHHPWFPCHF